MQIARVYVCISNSGLKVRVDLSRGPNGIIIRGRKRESKVSNIREEKDIVMI
jgi:hypothetical protein